MNSHQLRPVVCILDKLRSNLERVRPLVERRSETLRCHRLLAAAFSRTTATSSSSSAITVLHRPEAGGYLSAAIQDRMSNQHARRKKLNIFEAAALSPSPRRQSNPPGGPDHRPGPPCLRRAPFGRSSTGTKCGPSMRVPDYMDGAILHVSIHDLHISILMSGHFR
jgi:hypothetical protein